MAQKQQKPRQKRAKSTTPRIAQKLIAELNQHRQSKVIDLEAFRQARELAVEQHSKATDDLGDLHPLHALYTYMLTTVTDAANALGELPVLSKLMDRIEAAEEEYMPSGPPMSPLTHSFFINWALFDLTIGIHNESLGSCVGAVFGALGSHASRVAYVEHLCNTRPGIYVHEGFDGDHLLLHAFAWNLPLIRQGRDPESSRRLVQQLEAIWPHLPPEAEHTLKAMMTDRETTYRGDPRLATVTVKVLGEGDIRVHAEARVLGNPG